MSEQKLQQIASRGENLRPSGEPKATGVTTPDTRVNVKASTTERKA